MIELGDVGFRDVVAQTERGKFALVINGVPVFMHGVCWTPRDWTRLDVAAVDLEAELALLVEAGVNCLRLSGCFTYPSRNFLAACDRYGIMVWQDLMFSVLDYPESDSGLCALAEREVRQVSTSMQSHACLAVVCGNAEVAQQAVYSGVSIGEVEHSLFNERFAAVSASVVPEVVYRPGTPWGGALLFDTTQGTAHYFGVGAYRRDLSDARTSGVSFATESLPFANVPEPESLANTPDIGNRVHDAMWKRRVPRDGGAGWDFEDVRAHYVERLFGESALLLRETDPARYLALGRAASAAAVERTLQEFRRPGSGCGGALLWLWTDPEMGAGWV